MSIDIDADCISPSERTYPARGRSSGQDSFAPDGESLLGSNSASSSPTTNGPGPDSSDHSAPLSPLLCVATLRAMAFREDPLTHPHYRWQGDLTLGSGYSGCSGAYSRCSVTFLLSLPLANHSLLCLANMINFTQICPGRPNRLPWSAQLDPLPQKQLCLMSQGRFLSTRGFWLFPTENVPSMASKADSAILLPLSWLSARLWISGPRREASTQKKFCCLIVFAGQPAIGQSPSG